MEPLTHYIVVRRDLPFVVTVAQVAHAAGESFYQFAFRNKPVPRANEHYRSSIVCVCGQEFNPLNDNDLNRHSYCSGIGRGSSEKEQAVFNRQVEGLIPSSGSTPSLKLDLPDDWISFGHSESSQDGIGERETIEALSRAGLTKVVVLGARNEGRLLRLQKQLLSAKIPHVAIREPDAPWNSQMMAIGLEPGPADVLGQHVREFHMLPNKYDEK
jgi:peptidyl-tRNA hydrolase